VTFHSPAPDQRALKCQRIVELVNTATSRSYGPRGWQAVFRPVLITLLGLGVFVILPTFMLPRLGIKLDLRGRTLVALGGTLIVELVLFGFLLRWLRGQGRSLKEIGWNRPTTLPAIILGVGFALGYALYTLSNPFIGPNATEISPFKLAGVVVGIVGAFVEECVFRGYLITELKHAGTSTTTQILMSGVAFGIIHVGFDLAGILLTFVMGLALATAYVLGKRSLTPSIISHTLINILIEPWLLLFIITMYSRLGQLITP
jgi:membrane protease YdiL (CAAX protease family)